MLKPNKNFIFSCSQLLMYHLYFYFSYSLYTLVMPILILINVQYLQKVVFSFEKGQMVKTLLLRFSPPDKKIPPLSPQQNFWCQHPLTLFGNPCRMSKMPVSSPWEYIIFTSTSSQWLILFRKIWFCGLILHGGRNFINLVLIKTSSDTMKRCSPSRKSKDLLKVSKLFKFILIPLANTLTSGLLQYHLELGLVWCQLPLYLVDWSYTENYPCYNLQVWRCKPTNAWTTKPTNYLHVQGEHLHGAR